jgi:hypothetical protein
MRQPKEMRLETGETDDPRINKTEGNHRGRRWRLRSEEHREFVNEITVRSLFPGRSFVTLRRKQGSDSATDFFFVRNYLIPFLF